LERLNALAKCCPKPTKRLTLTAIERPGMRTRAGEDWHLRMEHLVLVLDMPSLFHNTSDNRAPTPAWPRPLVSQSIGRGHKAMMRLKGELTMMEKRRMYLQETLV
jgi:hypothetical protein